MSGPFGDNTPIDFNEDIHDAITGTVITATVEFRGTVFNSNSTNEIVFKTSGGTQFSITHTASAVNYLSTTGSPVSNAPWLIAKGNDSAVQLGLASKSTSPIIFRTNGISGATQFAITHTANAVNYLSASGAVTGADPLIAISGSDTNIGLVFKAKGTTIDDTQFRFVNGSDANLFRVDQATGTVYNNILARANVTGVSPYLAAEGLDTDVDFRLFPKGAGLIRFGTHTSVGAETVTGYISIKDIDGNVRKLAVIS